MNALLGFLPDGTTNRLTCNLISHILLIFKRCLFELRSASSTPSIFYIVQKIKKIITLDKSLQGRVINITVIVGWVGGREERRLWQNEQPTSFWCGCQPVKVIRPCRSMVFAKFFALHDASPQQQTTAGSAKPEVFLIHSPPRLISLKTTSVI